MSTVNIVGIGALRLQVTDLAREREFYMKAWGLEESAPSNDNRVALQTEGSQRMALELIRADRASLEGIELIAANDSDMPALKSALKKVGVKFSSGHGASIEVVGPEGLRVRIAPGVIEAKSVPSDRSKPISLTHVVINTKSVGSQLNFFVDLLGFRVSDVTARMTFIRCGADHHSLAFAGGDSLSLNHAAFEMKDIDGLMYGAGRVIEHGTELEWGLGRHGPGNNVFCYFIDPQGFAVEYTTEMLQIDEASFEAKDAQYWTDFPRRPCRCGVARKPSERLSRAFAGTLLNTE